MINLHLYSVPACDEARILRQAGTLARLGLFDRIDLIGVAQGKRRTSMPASHGVRRLRIGETDAATGPVRTMISSMRSGLAVYHEWRTMAIRCIHCHGALTLPLAVQLKRRTGAVLVYDGRTFQQRSVSGIQTIRTLLVKSIETVWIGQADYVIPAASLSALAGCKIPEKEMPAIYLDALGLRPRASGGTACNGVAI